MRVIITGGTGLIGRSLVEALACQGSEVIVLSRDPARAARVFERLDRARVHAAGWDGRTAEGWGHLLSVDTAIVNLAGASPAHWRWTPAYRTRILQSRLQAARAVMQAMRRYSPPAVLIQASASGYYGNRGQETLTEASPPGQGFRAEVCQAWEACAAGAPTRCCLLRTGMVLDMRAGAFPPLLRFAQLLGSALGSGQQWVPWIHHVDVTAAICFLLESGGLAGLFNLCAPDVVTHKEFQQAVRRVLRRPGVVTIPAGALRAALGELSSVVLDSQRMTPQRLLEAGFRFEYPRLDGALHDLLREERKPIAHDLRWRH